MASLRELHRKKYNAQILKYAKISITVKRLAFIMRWQALVNYSPDFYCFNKELMNATHLSLKAIERLTADILHIDQLKLTNSKTLLRKIVVT
ncbi:MAG: hypothetical protein HKP48_00180 [Winogradskyella sp.]|uniref:hypothetical protein n=1 Tax=Winogradskyella sp. TaxID=1883156 RepID=UPI0017B7BB74|nr:hypothetical protein [Winogradskyella sp.]MBT8244668.1 hypothetical protein [Winogradskyella sp.]NNK21733.1 hypothetical protein [Winogradskyella sp.]